MENIFDIQDTGFSLSPGCEGGLAQTDDYSVIDLARRVIQYFQAAQGGIQKKDWVEYGQYQERLEEAIRDLFSSLELEEA